jgi:hypothetical protein
MLGPLFAIYPSIQGRANFPLTLMAGSPIRTQRWLSLKAGLVSTPWWSSPTVTWRQQKALLMNMSKDEFKTYLPRANKKLRADPEIIRLARKYYASP